MATGGADHLVKVWNAVSGAFLFSVPHPKEVLEVVFGADSGTLLTACFDDMVRLWKLDPHPEEQWSLPEANLTAISIDADGHRVAAGSVDGTSKAWEISGRKEIRTFTPPHLSPVLAIALNGAGTQLATGTVDGALSLWDLGVPNRRPRTIPAHSDWIRSISFSPATSRLATTSRDGTLILWDAKTGAHLLTIDPHSGPLASAAFSPSGNYIATAGEDGVLRVFTLDIAELESLAHSRATRSLTPQECKTYLHRDSCPASH
jgi:WD40 repeat protein